MTAAGIDQAWEPPALDWTRVRRRIVGLARACGASDEIVDDVAQDVSIKLLKALAAFDPRRATLQAWLRTITRNEVLNHLRRGGRIERLAAPLPAEGAPHDPRPALEATLTVGALRARLGARENELLDWTVILGCTSEEAAPRLGVAPATVRSLKRHVLARLYDLADGERPAMPRGLDGLRTCSRLVR